MLDSFIVRYNPRQQDAHRRRLLQMFRELGKRDPEDLTVADLIRWTTGQLHDPLRPGRKLDPVRNTYSNNTVRQNLAFIGQFMAHCRRHGLAVVDPSDDFARLRKSYPRTYGKKQDAHPARWLTRDEARLLIASCSDGTWYGSRDQLVIRLGLLGLRNHEIRKLNVGNYVDGGLRFTGKMNKAATVPVGPVVQQLLARWLRHYAAELGRELSPGDPLIVAAHPSHQLRWGERIRTGATIGHITHRRAREAGLGEVAPHDLRRTAAGIMHREKSADGGHRYDLRDIQMVLRQSDPNITQRSYLDPIDTDAQDRAAVLLDLD